MSRVAVACSAVAFVAVPLSAQDAASPAGPPTVYVEPSGDGFEVYIAAAILKKGVPVSIVEKPESGCSC